MKCLLLSPFLIKGKKSKWGYTFALNHGISSKLNLNINFQDRNCSTIKYWWWSYDHRDTYKICTYYYDLTVIINVPQWSSSTVTTISRYMFYETSKFSEHYNETLQILAKWHYYLEITMSIGTLTLVDALLTWNKVGS